MTVLDGPGEQPPRLIDRPGSFLTEDVHGDAGKLRVNGVERAADGGVEEVGDVGVDRVTQESGLDDSARPGRGGVVNGPEHLELVLEREPVAALDLDGGGAAAQHDVEPMPEEVGELGLRGGADGSDRGHDAAAGGEDLEVRGAAPPQVPLVEAAARETRVRVAIDKAGHEHASPRVNDRVRRADQLDRRRNRHDPVAFDQHVPARDHGITGRDDAGVVEKE
ncbi:MAG: hypothetical protein L6Q35_12275 [Phycisphaerales bacterium]|nr:hypothetical protein [Phycisphaerales bacterium]